MGRDQRYQSSARANLQAGQAVEVGVRRIVLQGLGYRNKVAKTLA